MFKAVRTRDLDMFPCNPAFNCLAHLYLSVAACGNWKGTYGGLHNDTKGHNSMQVFMCAFRVYLKQRKFIYAIHPTVDYNS